MMVMVMGRVFWLDIITYVTRSGSERSSACVAA